MTHRYHAENRALSASLGREASNSDRVRAYHHINRDTYQRETNRAFLIFAAARSERGGNWPKAIGHRVEILARSIAGTL